MAHISNGIGPRDVGLLLRNKVSVIVEHNYVAAMMYDRMQHGAEPYVLVRHGLSEFRSKFHTMETSSRGTVVYEIIVGGEIVAKVAARTGTYYGGADRSFAWWARLRAQRQVLDELKRATDVYSAACST